jgi:hypothetical protein
MSKTKTKRAKYVINHRRLFRISVRRARELDREVARIIASELG